MFYKGWSDHLRPGFVNIARYQLPGHKSSHFVRVDESCTVVYDPTPRSHTVAQGVIRDFRVYDISPTQELHIDLFIKALEALSYK